MEKELTDLSNTILSTYQKNLEFLKLNFSDVYKDIDELSNQISNGKYEEKYALEFIDGYFDILDIYNNTYFYNRNSFIDADNREKHIDFSNNASLNLLRQHPLTKRLTYNPYYEEVAPLIGFMNESIDYDEITFEKIVKFIFIGTGLGLHITQLNNKLNPLNVLIIEPNIEIFRLSLFVTDYTILKGENKNLFLNIGKEKSYDIKKSLGEFYNYHNYLNFNIKHYQLLENYSYIKDEIVAYFSQNSINNFPYKLVIENLKRTVSFFESKEKFIDLEKLLKNKILKKEKVFLISAGPSLDEYIDIIKENQNKFVIVCVDVILKKLIKNDIIPDIIVSIDPLNIVADFFKIDDPKMLKDSAILFLSQQHEDVLKTVKDYNYYFSQVMPIIPKLGYFGTVSNVGSFSFMMSLHLGAQELYLIGTDASFDQKTGRRYTKDSSFEIDDKMNNDESLFDRSNFISKDDVIEVKGNLEEKVKTNRELLAFKSTYENLINTFEGYSYKAYNLSESGVFIDGLIPLEKNSFINRLQTFNKKDFIGYKEFNKVTKYIDKMNMENDIKFCNLVLSRIKKYKKYNIDNKDNLLNNKLELMVWILEKTKKTNIVVYNEIFMMFTEFIDAYLYYFLNLKQNKLHKKENLSKVYHLWCDGLISIFKEMKKAIKV